MRMTSRFDAQACVQGSFFQSFRWFVHSDRAAEVEYPAAFWDIRYSLLLQGRISGREVKAVKGLGFQGLGV